MTQPKNAKDRPVQCTCVRDTFADLPPELRLRPKKKATCANHMPRLRAGLLDQPEHRFVYGM